MSATHKITHDQLVELAKETMVSIILSLQHQLAEQALLIQELQDQLAKHSRNSGNPPSSDGLKKLRTRSLRKKSGRRPGGQKGQPGHSLEMVTQPDHIQHHPVSCCPDCAADLREVEPCRHEKRQVFDIPPEHIEVTEHQAGIKHCPKCGQQVKATFPLDVGQAVQYGARLQAQASYLNNYQFIPLSRSCQLLDDFFGHRPTEAFVLQANASLVAQIDPSLAAITAQSIAAAVAHYDESGLGVAGNLNWLHVAATQLLTYYDVHPIRGQVAMRAIGILAMFAGTAVHDHWKSYFTFDNCQHALCNAHHLRELLFIVEQYQQTWAQDMAQLLLDIKAKVENAALEDNSLSEPLLSFFEQCYDQLIEQGLAENPPPPEPAQKKRGHKEQSPPNNLLDRLQSYKPQVLAYMSDSRVHFDNNLAEGMSGW